jgi:2'-phosphotransferase
MKDQTKHTKKTMKQSSFKTKSNRTKKHNNEEVALSKALSWILRHSALQLKLVMSSDGYVPIPILLQCQARNMNQYTVDDIMKAVETNEKQRFKVCQKFIRWEDGKTKYAFLSSNNCGGGGDNGVVQKVMCIRANQGHSISGINCEELLTKISSDELASIPLLIHGTNKDSWENHIQRNGLNRMTRNHIHFARGLPGSNGVVSGMRRGSQILIYIDAEACAMDGVSFYKSDNGVILCPGVDNGTLPIRYFSSVIEAKTNKELLLQEIK